MTTRTVTGTVNHSDNTPWVGGTVAFRLLEPFATATAVVPRDAIDEVLDSNGQLLINLEVPDTGTAHYSVTLPDSYSFEFYLASGPATDLMTLMTIAGSSVAQDDLQTLLDTYTTISVSNYFANGIIYDAIEVVLAYGDLTLTLRPSTNTHLTHIVKNMGTGVITVVPTAGDNIDGGSYVLIGKNLSAKFMDIGSSTWITI